MVFISFAADLLDPDYSQSFGGPAFSVITLVIFLGNMTFENAVLSSGLFSFYLELCWAGSLGR